MKRTRWSGAMLLGSLALVASGLAGCPEQPANKADGAVATPAQGPASAGAPVITCAEATYDFGTVAQGQEVQHVFTIKNTGTAALNIKRAKGG